MKILNPLKKTYAYQVFTFSKEWKRTGLIVLMDIFFFSLLFATAKIFDYIFTKHEALFTGTWTGYILLLVYFLSVVAVYSFFKYCILQFLTNSTIEAKINGNKFGRFYAYNCISICIIIVLFISLTTFVTVSLVSVLKQTALIIFVGVFACASYYFMTVSHIFFNTSSIKELPAQVYASLNWKTIGQWIGWNIGILFLYFSVYVIMYMIIRTTTENLALLYVLNLVMFVIITVEAYFLLYWNRLYLFFKINTKL